MTEPVVIGHPTAAELTEQLLAPVWMPKSHRWAIALLIIVTQPFCARHAFVWLAHSGIAFSTTLKFESIAVTRSSGCAGF